MNIRNNVVVAIDCLDKDEAMRVCKVLATRHEIDGGCRNFTSVTLNGGQAALSMRSCTPMETSLEIMTMLQEVGVTAFDIATRPKLSDDWTIMRAGGRRRIRLNRRGERLSLEIKKTVIPRTRMLSI